jgi:transcriptional regulator with XRE-family HTH domain
MLKMSAAELAERAEVTLRTVQRMESFEGVPPSRGGTLERIQTVLEAAGIEFIGDPVTSPGVRLHSDKRPE